MKEYHDKKNFGGRVKLRNLVDIEKFKNEKGFELIADALGIEYPARP